MANVKTLDKTRPYGEVWGQVEGVSGARFAQDGALFDAGGRLLVDMNPAPVVEEAPLVPMVDQAPVAPMVDPAPAVPVVPAKSTKKAPPGLPTKE